jgi:hypothetical protein
MLKVPFICGFSTTGKLAAGWKQRTSNGERSCNDIMFAPCSASRDEPRRTMRTSRIALFSSLYTCPDELPHNPVCCSASSIAIPALRTTWSCSTSASTTRGAKPSLDSSNRSTRQFATNARAIARSYCSPPLSHAPFDPLTSASNGNTPNTLSNDHALSLELPLSFNPTRFPSQPPGRSVASNHRCCGRPTSDLPPHTHSATNYTPNMINHDSRECK